MSDSHRIHALQQELDELKADFEIVRRASRLWEEASNNWMKRALKAEQKEQIDGLQQRPESDRGNPPTEGEISDRLGNFDSWGNRIKERD